MGAHGSPAVEYKILYTNQGLRFWQTCSPTSFLTCPCPCTGHRSGGSIPSPSVWSFCSISKCQEWLWSSVLHLCLLGQGYLGMGWRWGKCRAGAAGSGQDIARGGSWQCKGTPPASPSASASCSPSTPASGLPLYDPLPTHATLVNHVALYLTCIYQFWSYSLYL